MSRRVLAAVLLLAYPAVVHWSLVTGRKEVAVWALVLLCVSMAALFLPKTRRRVALGVTVLCLVFGIILLQGLTFPIVLPALSINVFLLWLFGRTLLPGREPLITRFARLLEPDELPPEVVRYTRGVTLLWCVVFAALTLQEILLAIFAAPEVWSLYANFINYLLVAALFIIEYGYRRWRFRHRTHPSPLQFAISLAKIDWRRLSLR